jgi:tetratricopeptide (TPR) repeat protein
LEKPVTVAEPARAAAKRSAPASAKSRALDFRELAQAGRYREALAASEQAGFERLCRSANAQDLMLLADIARLAGDAGRARQAYERMRERFPGEDDGQAAFFLGRLAFDERADYAQAARYFELSLGEQPAGPLAREAAGRLMEARLLSGDGEGARAAARAYLKRHADGPHGRTARRLLATP